MSTTELYYQLIAPISQGGEGRTVLQAAYRLWQMQQQGEGQQITPPREPCPRSGGGFGWLQKLS